MSRLDTPRGVFGLVLRIPTGTSTIRIQGIRGSVSVHGLFVPGVQFQSVAILEEEKKEKNVVIINNKKLFLKIRTRKSRHRHTRNKTNKRTDGCDAGRHVFIKAAFCLKLCTSSLLLLLLLLLVVLARAGAVAAAEAYDFMLELVVGWVLIV